MPTRIFLSWSGPCSHKVACTLRDWLPSVIQSVKPYVSSEDIDKGTRWSTDIANELEASSYGIICVTPDNLNAPWIAFEAGALSKTIDKSNVTPFLFGVKRSEIKGPLLQFQSVIFDKEDVFKLTKSINQHVPEDGQLEESALKRSFEVWWQQLEEGLKSITVESPEPPRVGETTAERQDILEEILELVRGQQRLLSDPELVLPPAYLDFIVRRSSRSGRTREVEQAAGRLHSLVIKLENELVSCNVNEQSDAFRKATAIASDLHEAIHSLDRSPTAHHRRERELHRRLNETERLLVEETPKEE